MSLGMSASTSQAMVVAQAEGLMQHNDAAPGDKRHDTRGVAVLEPPR
jgi:hypothetical protein